MELYIYDEGGLIKIWNYSLEVLNDQECFLGRKISYFYKIIIFCRVLRNKMNFLNENALPPIIAMEGEIQL